MKDPAFFELQHTDPLSSARAGLIHTDHGDIHTPIFMPVGTVGSVKGVQLRDLYEDINAEIILGNTYHLYLRPGTTTLEAAGGLHKVPFAVFFSNEINLTPVIVVDRNSVPHVDQLIVDNILRLCVRSCMHKESTKTENMRGIPAPYAVMRRHAYLLTDF